MKRLFHVLILGFCFFFLTGCSHGSIEEIDYKALKEKIDHKESFVIEFIQTGCSHCEEFSPRLKSIVEEYGITAFSLNLSNLTKEENKKLNKIIYVSGTPTVAFFKKGEEETIYRIVGAASDKEVINKFKTLNYIK